MDLNIKITDNDAIEVLTAIHEKYLSNKSFYKKYTDEIDRTGITSPEEIKIVYNNILDQLQQQGSFKSLKLIK